MDMEFDWLVVSPEEAVRIEWQYWREHEPWLTQRSQVLTLVLGGLDDPSRHALYDILTKKITVSLSFVEASISKLVKHIYK
jgi:hypothetical protein